MSGPDDATAEEPRHLLRPGWTLRLDHLNEEGGCSKSIGTYSRLLTQREIAMMGFANMITDKTEWQLKVFDDAIVSKWRSEVLAERDEKITEEIFDWCMSEIRDKAKCFKVTNFVNILDSHFTAAKSDSIVPESLRLELIAACKRLQDVPDSARDWHPKSNNQVLNLVHPSLYPLVYGVSRVLDHDTVPLRECSAAIGQGKTIPIPPELDHTSGSNHDEGLWSRNFQWLPAELKFDADGHAKIDSYINNLHPVGNEALYDVLEKLVDAAIPMWNECLPIEHLDVCENRDGALRVPCDGSGIYDPPEPDWKWSPPPKDTGNGEDGDDDDDDASTDSDDYPEGHWKHIRRIIQPKPIPYEDWPHTRVPESSDFDLRTFFSSSGLQVIFKLSSIELTPSNTSYPGGSWHVEGQFNEHIAATAIYYYSNSNITNSYLSFRQEWDQEQTIDLEYLQNDHEGLEHVFGFAGNWDSEAVQETGNVNTKQGRLLVFPNVWQHRVGGFELADKTQPGHRRFLVMWLIDPWNRALSTANVPPQQKSWWMRELMRTNALDKLPTEIMGLVGDEVDGFPVGEEEAKEARLRLMQERTFFQAATERNISTFTLCEH